MEKKVCVQCGDIGYKNKLVYCFKCTQYARHRYCMDVMPKTKHESVVWSCEQCEYSSNRDRPSLKKKSTKRKNIVLESDEEKPCEKSKKSPTEPKSEGFTTNSSNNNFLYSFSTFRDIKPGKKHVLNQENQFHDSAEPLIRSVWTGFFDIFNNNTILKRRDCVTAFLSSKACEKVRETAAKFQPVIRFGMLSRSHVWPKSFHESGPTDDSIAIYFFPFMKHENIYDYLVFEMIRDDLAMRTFVQDAELLIFPSTLLPSQFWRFQGRLYLWGVFRGKE